MSGEAVIEAVRREVPRAVDAFKTPDGKGRCLVASRIGLETLRYFGVEVEPYVTIALSANRAWIDWMDETRGATPMPDEAWSVAIDPRENGSGYAGHLVLRLGNRLLDLDAREMARPQHGIFVPETVLVEIDLEGEEEEAFLELAEGGTLHYLKHRYPPRYATAKGWRKPEIVRAAGPVIRRIRQQEGIA